jgi:8-oxo-dGTP pyrophosphatase MutT (NUDIX family)
MRHSNLALVLIRIEINDEPHLLLIRDQKWNDWTLVGGHVEPHEQNDWAFAAARECNEELAPLRYGRDFILVPLFIEPMRWGPIPSKSADGELTTYAAQVFALRFLATPAKCLEQLPPGEFRLVPESVYVTDLSRSRDKVTIVARALGGLSQAAMAWDASLRNIGSPNELFAKY